MLSVAACDSDTTPIVQSAGRTSAEVDRDTTRLGPNDRVRVIVFGQPTLTGEYALDGNGVLAFPLVGNIPANGQTTGDLQKTIAAKLQPDYLTNPSVSVEVVTRRPFFVIGEVNKPGNYPYVTDMTALNAVAMAGGFTYRARKNNFYIKRLDQDGKMVRVVAQGGTILQPGDTLEVRERMF
jgi:protein involved in polysaccharide export with SLBB domain